MNWMNTFGGWPGVATFALMACGATALPLRFTYYDNLILLVFSAFTYLLAANSAAYAFGRPEVALALSEGAGYGDRSAVVVRATAPALVGVLGWAAIVGLALLSLNNVRPSAPMPSMATLAGMLAMNASLAWMVAVLGALLGLNVQTVKGTRDLLRMGLTFLLTLAVLGFFVSPGPWRASLARLTRRDNELALALVAAAGLFAVAGELVLRRALRVLAEKRQGLSILG